MSLLDRLNTYIIGRLPSRRLSSILTGVSDEGLQIRQGGDMRLVAWPNVEQVTALTTSTLAADRLAVVMLFDDGGTLAVHEDDAVWLPLLAAMPVALPGIERDAEWQLRAIGSPQSVAVIYQR